MGNCITPKGSYAGVIDVVPSSAPSSSLPDMASTGMLTHLYKRKPLRKIMWPSAITRLTAHSTCDLMSDLVISKHRIKNMIIDLHDIECPY